MIGTQGSWNPGKGASDGTHLGRSWLSTRLHYGRCRAGTRASAARVGLGAGEGRGSAPITADGHAGTSIRPNWEPTGRQTGPWPNPNLVSTQLILTESKRSPERPRLPRNPLCCSASSNRLGGATWGAGAVRLPALCLQGGWGWPKKKRVVGSKRPTAQGGDTDTKTQAGGSAGPSTSFHEHLL